MTDKRRVSFSHKEQPIKEIETFFYHSEKALRSYYQSGNLYFIGYTLKELEDERDRYIDELDKSSAFTILATIEAHLRVDYLQRCYNKKRDPLSRKFRDLYNEKGSKVSLSDDILNIWIQHTNNNSLIFELRAALRYRHWLAHGRYWVAKLRRKYDFYNILALAESLQTKLGIQMGA